LPVQSTAAFFSSPALALILAPPLPVMSLWMGAGDGQRGRRQ
jgi:hypothetical protein